MSEDFLLALATIAATLIGLLMLGGFFYLETGMSRVAAFEGHALPFLRTTIKLTVALYVFVLGCSLGLAVLDPTWMRVLFAALAIVLVAALVDWNLRYVALAGVVQLPRSSPWITWPIVVALLVWPWAIGGWSPDRGAYTAAALLAGGLGLVSTVGLLLTTFDLSVFEARDEAED